MADNFLKEKNVYISLGLEKEWNCLVLDSGALPFLLITVACAASTVKLSWASP